MVIGQYLYISRRPPFWAWLIVGGFFDVHGTELWHTEIYIRHGDLSTWRPDGQESDNGTSTRGRDLTGKFESRDLPVSYLPGFLLMCTHQHIE